MSDPGSILRLLHRQAGRCPRPTGPRRYRPTRLRRRRWGRISSPGTFGRSTPRRRMGLGKAGRTGYTNPDQLPERNCRSELPRTERQSLPRRHTARLRVGERDLFHGSPSCLKRAVARVVTPPTAPMTRRWPSRRFRHTPAPITLRGSPPVRRGVSITPLRRQRRSQLAAPRAETQPLAARVSQPFPPALLLRMAFAEAARRRRRRTPDAQPGGLVPVVVGTDGAPVGLLPGRTLRRVLRRKPRSS